MIKEIKNNNIKEQITIPQIPFIIDDISGNSKMLVVKPYEGNYRLIELNKFDNWNMYAEEYVTLEEILDEFQGCDFYDFNIELLSR